MQILYITRLHLREREREPWERAAAGYPAAAVRRLHAGRRLSSFSSSHNPLLPSSSSHNCSDRALQSGCLGCAFVVAALLPTSPLCFPPPSAALLRPLFLSLPFIARCITRSIFSAKLAGWYTERWRGKEEEENRGERWKEEEGGGGKVVGLKMVAKRAEGGRWGGRRSKGEGERRGWLPRDSGSRAEVKMDRRIKFVRVMRVRVQLFSQF